MNQLWMFAFQLCVGWCGVLQSATHIHAHFTQQEFAGHCRSSLVRGRAPSTAQVEPKQHVVQAPLHRGLAYLHL